MNVVVYAIYDKTINEIYVGFTKDLSRRIAEHKRGQSRYTKKFKNFVIIFTEVYDSYKSARVKEKYLKSGIGKEYLRTLIDKRV